MSRFLSVFPLAAILFLAGQVEAQTLKGPLRSAVPPAVAPESVPVPVGEPDSAPEPIPEYDIKIVGRVRSETPIERTPFVYEVELSWEGEQNWFSLSAPAIEWPEGIRQVEVGTESKSSVGAQGPIGLKSFLYTLEAITPGDYELPELAVEILAPGREDPIALEAPGTSISVAEKPTPASDKIKAALAKNGLLFLGIGLVVVFALLVAFLKRGSAGKVQEETPDPWPPIRTDLDKAGALRSAGKDREYYVALERVLTAALALIGKTAKSGFEEFTENTTSDLKTLFDEIAERKYRPDRPRPEEMDRSFRLAKNVLKEIEKQPLVTGTTGETA